jgi:hypothetical protein
MPRIKVCVFDNASGDSTEDVVKELAAQDPRVRYFCQPENIGLLPNFNFALRSVDTPYFSFLCDDDLLLPHFYETALAGFERHPEAMSSSGTILFAALDGRYVMRGPSIADDEAFFQPPESLFAWRLHVRPLVTSNLLRREVIDSVGDLPPGFLSDLAYEMELAARHPIVACNRPCAIVMEHAASSTKSDEQNMESWNEGYRSIEGRLRAVPGVRMEAVDRALATLRGDIADTLYQMGILAVTRGRYDYARRIAAAVRDRWTMAARARRIEVAAGIAQRIPGVQPTLAALRKLRADRRSGLTPAATSAILDYAREPRAEFTL